jgi:predicted lactoylglutathione lyase
VSRLIFVNLPVKDLPASKESFKALGFGFGERFTDDSCASMVVSEQAYGRSFHDLDGHLWEIMWMSAEAVEQGPADMAQTA